MLIGKPKRKWSRDVAVADLVDYFDQFEQRILEANPKKPDLWAHLSDRELAVITSEIGRCRDDFSYAARNYFWIINKLTNQDQLLKLWESQEFVLEEIERVRRSGFSQRFVIVKARQLGMSTLAESLIAHRTIFTRNSDAFIVSYDDDHAAYLFGIVQHVYDKLPWWMRPLCASREFKKGLFLENPDPEERRLNPGMNSRITAKGAQAVTGVGQGRRLVACHISEFCDFEEAKAREIIEEDIENALVDSAVSFGLLESTAKGAGTYSHDFWLRMEKMGDRATWQPLFMPWFFDQSRRRTISFSDWKPRQEEKDLRERASQDWVRCDNHDCDRFKRRHFGKRDWLDQPCDGCGTGTLRFYTIPDDQLAWMEWRRQSVEDDEESLNTLKQEMASTAEEAFRLTGQRLFSEKALAFAQSCILAPLYGGFIDRTLRFHAVNAATGKCIISGCDIDHGYDPDDLMIWELPTAHAEYVVCGDVAEGLGGKNDHSALHVLKINRYGGEDEQVATFASNTIDPEAFADLVNRVGRFYNDALVVTEINATAGGIVAHALRVKLQYPNLYRPIRAGHVNMDGGSMIGWKTTAGTKPTIYLATRKALDSRMLRIRCKFTVSEINNFRKEDGSTRRMGAMIGHDDRIMALMIGYFVAHERDWDEDGGTIRYRTPLSLENAPYIYTCRACNHQWPGMTPNEYPRCPECNSMHLSAEAQVTPQMEATIDVTPVLYGSITDEDRVLPTYHEL